MEDGFVGALGFREPNVVELTLGRDVALLRGAEDSGVDSAAAASRARVVEMFESDPTGEALVKEPCLQNL